MSFVVVCVVKILNTNVALCNTLRDVPEIKELSMFNLRVDMHLLFSHLVILQITSLVTLLLFDLERPNSTGNTCGRRVNYYGIRDQPGPNCKV